MAFVQRAQDCLDVPIWAPAFSHADKDPVPDAIRIEPTHRILLFEGLYCCLDEEPWVQAARCWDRAWFLHVSTQVARSRLIQRHLESGIVHDEADAAERGMYMALSPSQPIPMIYPMETIFWHTFMNLFIILLKFPQCLVATSSCLAGLELLEIVSACVHIVGLLETGDKVLALHVAVDARILFRE